MTRLNRPRSRTPNRSASLTMGSCSLRDELPNFGAVKNDRLPFRKLRKIICKGRVRTRYEDFQSSYRSETICNATLSKN